MIATGIFVLLTTDLLMTAGSFTWTAPPPSWIPSDGSDIRTVHFPVLNGSTNVALRWNYTLGDGEILFATSWTVDGKQAASLSSGSLLTINDDRFAVDTSEVATLIIKNVSDIEDITVQCKAQTNKEIWAYNIQVEIMVPPRITSYTHNKTVDEGCSLDLYCNTTGKPAPNITWTTVLEDGTNNNLKVLFIGNPWNITYITRNYSGTYRCTADNGIGSPVNRTIAVNVLFKPDIVALEKNTTENSACSDVWVNFTCNSSKAYPPVYNYGLIKNETVVSFSKKGTWIEKISQGQTSVYKCLAYQQVDNVTSTNNISISVKVPPAVEQMVQNVTVEEGRNVTKKCDVTAGNPYPTVFWENIKTGDTFGNPLIIIRIKKSQHGKYRCIANNTCGSDLTTTFIDVQFGVKDVTLERNTTENNGCNDLWVNFTCNSSEANPPVHNYLLLKNGTEVSLSKKGTWIEKVSRGEAFVYLCQAYQKIDNVTSANNVTVAVNEPPSVEQLQNKTVDEGGNFTVECNVTAGTPTPTVFWKDVKSGQVIEGKMLNRSTITRNQTEYRCFANNTCGGEYATLFIDVQYVPDKVNLDFEPSNTVCRGSTVQLTCTADANPPVHTYVLFENGTRDSTDKFGKWEKLMNTSGNFVFKCEAHSSKGNGTSKDTILNVNDPPAVQQAQNVTVKEGENVVGECNLTLGTPPLNLVWENGRTGQDVKSGKLLTITKITRYQTEYRCVANNTCGRDSTTMFIDVQYEPLASSQKGVTVKEGDPMNISCLQDSGNPAAVVMWYKGNDTSGNKTTNSSTLEFQNAATSDEGWYTCFATNVIKNVSATFFLIVEQKTSPAPTTEPSTASNICSEPLSANKFHGKAKVDAACENRSEIAKKFVNTTFELLKNEDIELGESCGTSCSSVVVDFILKFRKAIDGAHVVNILKQAAEQDRFDGLKVYPDSIIQISSTTTLSASTVRPSSEERCHESFLIKENCEKNMLNIGIVIGFAVGVLLCCCLLVWWVHKRRKCNKDSKEAVSPGDVQPLSSNHSTLSDGKPCDYAMSGPQPPVDLNNEQQLGAVPTYAFVDESRKREKKKKKETAEKLGDDQYAVVEKSKKKKKNEADNTYAEVDTSKKFKKLKPGDVLYADLGEFHQMKKMPEVSTSPKALPPIKPPEAYVETQYADITQFLKGYPEDPSAELPKYTITPAVSDTATGSKEESSPGNTGDGAQAANETGF